MPPIQPPVDGFLFLEKAKFAESFAADVAPELATEDKMIPPEAQRAMSKRAGSTVVEAKGSHAIYVSKPQAVAAIIADAAKGAGTPAQ